ncbi:uncharacterized protein pdzph1 [Betta splendens]|uniref:Uncharacterized protein pdzph1 n=1 Tax=Betta splendens TaxID=158456 RepID=A0A6P7P144_BETSP|nr:uncharacterized protein pdzph1 [Betta splendens]XP_040929059.1 uncharacterized protein pdzph1 [Betta splendens]
MTKRGRRRSSRRRRSSSSSKQSVSDIFQKHNKSNSVSYKDDLLEKGQTDCLRKENVLSGSENEERHKDYQMDPSPESKRKNHNQEAENEVKTRGSDGDRGNSTQQSHQQTGSPPSATPANVVNIYCTGSNVKLEIQEILHSDTCGIKTTVVYINQEEISLRDKREKMPDNESSEVTSQNNGSRSEATEMGPAVDQNMDQNMDQSMDQSMDQNLDHSMDQCLDVPPPQQFADAPDGSEEATLTSASCWNRLCKQAEVEAFFDLSDSDTFEPLLMRASLSTNRSSFTKDFINCQKRKSWIRNNSIATIEQRTYVLQKKRRQTFPGLWDARGLMLDEVESSSSLVLLTLHLQTERLLANRRGNHSSKCSSEAPSRQNRKQSSLALLHKTDDAFACSVSKETLAADQEACQSEAVDSGCHQADARSQELQWRELPPKASSIHVIPPSCSGSEEQIEESPEEEAKEDEGFTQMEHTSALEKLHKDVDPLKVDIEEAPRDGLVTGSSPVNCSKAPQIQPEQLSRPDENKAAASRCHSGNKEPLRATVPKEPDYRQNESDHWGKRRKLFKETKQEAAGSSVTSDVTEESASVDALDTIFLHHENNRGFYTETFHSSAWIYRGDDPGPVPPSTRTRTVSIRERTVRISKGSGEYPWGFRIQFSEPIVVTEVDTNGAAEEAGLVVGDYVLTVNGTDVSSIPHSEAAALARRGPDVLTLTVGSDIACCPNTPRPACRGYLHKRTHTGLIKGWRKRWFVLTHDCCLYYYRHRRDEGRRRAVSALRLEGAEVGQDASLGKPFVFRCRPQAAGRVYFYCATSSQEMKRWLEALRKAVHPITQNHVWVDVTRHNSHLPPLAVKNPECLGLLHTMDKNKDVWLQHYCILMDGCLYLYSGIRATHAHGGIYLQGYKVREQPYGTRKSTIELKPPSDEFKTFYLCAENPSENQRWMVALTASIKKWLPLHQALQDYMNRAPEETRM